MAQTGTESAKSSTASSMTTLHRAVLHDDITAVRKIVGERELGVDVRTAAGTTPLMIAALYGRLQIFIYLLGKKASPQKQDGQGNDLLAYVKQRAPSVRILMLKYMNAATVGPDRNGRREIYVLLKSIKQQIKMGRNQGQAAAQPQAQPQPQAQAPAQPCQAAQQQLSQDPPTRFVFLRSPGGRKQEFVEVRQVAVAKHGNLLRHCTGFIRGGSGPDEKSDSVFAISGWGIKTDNVARENVLDDMEYIELVKEVSAVLDFELTGNDRLDQKFPGTPYEQKGAFVACHSEKKLAVYVLKNALSHVLNTKAITISNINSLKEQMDKLPPGLRETIIHLDHEIVCPNCIKFLKTLMHKTGLVFRCESTEWYIPGERSQLRLGSDGQYQPVTRSRATRPSGSDEDADYIDDELDLSDTIHYSGAGLQDDPADGQPEQGDNVTTRTDPATPRRRTGHRSSSAPRRVQGSSWPKEGSEVSQEPPYNSYPYPKIDVTPPSRNIQALPTPRSHARVNFEMSRVSTSPSPTGRSSDVGSRIHASSMSPSLSQEWEVEEIIATEERDGARWFLVKWRGYPEEHDSWECESNLANAQEAIGKFMEELRAFQS